jgi:hypothetical protein
LNCRTLGIVKQPELDTCEISIYRHLATKGINLPNNLSFGLAPDGRIATHLGNRIDIASEE